MYTQRERKTGGGGNRGLFPNFTLRFLERKWSNGRRRAQRREGDQRTMERKAACRGQIKEELARRKKKSKGGGSLGGEARGVPAALSPSSH